MRSLVLLSFAFILGSFQAPKAQAYYGQIHAVNVFVNQYNAIARVQNISYYPMVCSGYVYGMSSTGFVFNTYANNVFIAPGAFLDIYVRSNSIYDPMIDARADIRCFH